MDALKIEATADTPAVLLDKANNVFEISGNSYPEDATAFYGPVIQWVKEYTANPNEITEFVFKFIYFNSSSYKSIYDIILLLETVKQKGLQAKVQWFYKEGDVDIKDAGAEFSEVADVPFTFSAF